MDQTLDIDGDVWRVLSVGAYSAGSVYCHLVSTTRQIGKVPVQVAIYVEAALVERALNRPARFYSWNRSLQGAFVRGERDRASGLTIDACPYKDARKANGQLTWSRAFRSAWRDGFHHAQNQDVS